MTGVAWKKILSEEFQKEESHLEGSQMLQFVPPKILMLIFWVLLEEIMEWISVLLSRPSARSVSFRCSGNSGQGSHGEYCTSDHRAAAGGVGSRWLLRTPCLPIGK